MGPLVETTTALLFAVIQEARLTVLAELWFRISKTISTWPHFGPKLSSYLRVPPSGSMGFWFHNKIDVTSNSTAFVSSIIFILCRAKGATLHSILYTSFWGYLEKAHLVPPKYKPPGSLIIIIHIHPQMHFDTNETTPQEKKNMEKMRTPNGK